MVVPVVGDTLNIAEAIENPTPVNIAAAAIGVIPVVGPEIAAVTRAAKGAEEATGFLGRAGNELKNAPFQKLRNEATEINGRDFS